MAKQIQAERGATFLHPSNDMDVILGQGTAAKELLAEYPDLEYIFTPVGGGGLVAGTILSARHFGTNCKVVGGEPYEADDAYRSLQSGKIETNETANTIADGLRTNLGDQNFPIIQQGIEKIVRVTEEEIISAMRLILGTIKNCLRSLLCRRLGRTYQRKRTLPGQTSGYYHFRRKCGFEETPF